MAEEMSIIIITEKAEAVTKFHWKMQKNGKLGTCLNICQDRDPE